MNARIASIMARTGVAAAMLVAAAAGGAGVAQALGVSAVLLAPFGSSASGQGVVSPSVDGTSVAVAITGGRPNATFLVSACQSFNILLASTCTAAMANNTVTADGSGIINATVALPSIPELDSIVIQDVVDSSDAYVGAVGPNPPLVSPVVITTGQLGLFNPFPGLAANAVPSSTQPDATCPAGLTGFLLINSGPSLVIVRCP